jgi:hypothetical protein
MCLSLFMGLLKDPVGAMENSDSYFQSFRYVPFAFSPGLPDPGRGICSASCKTEKVKHIRLLMEINYYRVAFSGNIPICQPRNSDNNGE